MSFFALKLLNLFKTLKPVRAVDNQTATKNRRAG